MMGDLTPRQPGEAKPVPSQLRASHEDRDAVIEVLRVAAGDGRLTADELDERLEIAFNARTYGELAKLTADLPATGRPLPAAAPVAAKDVIKIETRSGHTVKDGRWVVPKRLELRVTSGHVRLDLTEAIITHPTLRIDAEVRSGHLRIITRPGISVDTDDVQVRSGHVRVKTPWGAEVPVLLHVSISGKIGSGHLQAGPRRPHRSFWQWLTRAPLRPWAGSENGFGPDQRRRLSQAG